MLKKYRRDFVLLNTLTVGIVLMITLSFLGAVVYINEYDDMESVRSMSVRPWNYPGGDQRQRKTKLSRSGASITIPDILMRISPYMY